MAPATLRNKLIAWYDRERRDLPWRRTRDPYAIWVSEVMLQQTRVETVIPYYERFLARFPTVESLAAADEDAVLAHWSGLGYYRRARLLHRGVREVVSSYGGQVPVDEGARQALPGVGRYTAGAIGSIAYGREEPVVDGNVSRVLARLCRIETPLGKTETTRRLWSEAQRLVRGERPGDLNQALMELGATLCTPRRPGCERCPARAYCKGLAAGNAESLPVRLPRRPPKPQDLEAVVATRGRGSARRVWLIKGDEALFGGLWSVPMQSEARDALRKAGLAARLRNEPSARVEHVLTHRRLRIDVFRAPAARGTPSESLRLFDIDALDGVGVSSLTRKILRQV